jgi:enediyne biosynthesis protein E4
VHWLWAPLALLLSAALAILEVFRPVGVDFTHRNSPTEQRYLIETMGGGVALLDFNNDGLLDIFLVNGGKLEDPHKVQGKVPANFSRQDPAYWNRLYRQNPGGSFTDVTAAAGLSKAGNDYGMGVAVGDYNNDGFPDIYVTNYGRNILYRNNGNGTFTDVTGEAGVAAGGWSVSAGFLDYDNDGRLDLFVSRYLDYDLSRNILCGTPFHSYCRPDKYEGTTNLLFHNEGNGRFRDVSSASGIASVKGKGMGVAFNDYDDDGFPDIFVSNDLMEQFLFRNKGNGSFEERGLEAGVALSDDGKPYSGMGAAFADFDNDGLPDITVTNLALEKFALYHNDGGGHFSYGSLATGLAGVSARSSGWGVGLYDFDNDGWKDLFAAQGHVLDNVERINSALRYLEPPGLYRNVAGKFQKPELQELPAVAGRGTAFGDLDNDGTIDAVISVLGGHPLVLRGRPNKNHWLTLKLIGTTGNRDGMGAKVRIGKQWVYATTSGSYLSASDSRVHFGLGSETRVTVEIRWPSGKRQTVEDIPVDRIVTVEEPR